MPNPCISGTSAISPWSLLGTGTEWFGWVSISNPPAIDRDTRILAATAYGEASTQVQYEELAAIANVIVRKKMPVVIQA
jgi:hypothetical protein